MPGAFIFFNFVLATALVTRYGHYNAQAREMTVTTESIHHH
jgi:nitrate/nitrite transporter NarK